MNRENCTLFLGQMQQPTERAFVKTVLPSEKRNHLGLEEERQEFGCKGWTKDKDSGKRNEYDLLILGNKSLESMDYSGSCQRLEGDRDNISLGPDIDGFLWLMGHHWKLLSKDGHQSCILENVGQKGIAWKQQSPGIRL